VSKAGQCGYRGQRDESCTERDRAGRFHHVTQNGVQFETYESFISGIFHLIFLGRGYRILGYGGSTVYCVLSGIIS
jgi:hypothetical protein